MSDSIQAFGFPYIREADPALNSLLTSFEGTRRRRELQVRDAADTEAQVPGTCTSAVGSILRADSHACERNSHPDGTWTGLLPAETAQARHNQAAGTADTQAAADLRTVIYASAMQPEDAKTGS